MALFLSGNPLLVDVPFNTAHRLSNTAVMTVSRLGRRRMYGRMYTYGTWWGGIYRVVLLLPPYLGGYMRLILSLFSKEWPVLSLFLSPFLQRIALKRASL